MFVLRFRIYKDQVYPARIAVAAFGGIQGYFVSKRGLRSYH